RSLGCCLSMCLDSVPCRPLFSCAPPHPHLHSFPTRRSSDLLQAFRALGAEVAVNDHVCEYREPAISESFAFRPAEQQALVLGVVDRKSTRLNSSHVSISYAVFCLQKKNVAGDDDLH